jgi:hypothetical protein
MITLEMLNGACKHPLVRLANLGKKADDVVTDAAIAMSNSPLWTAYLEERFAQVAGVENDSELRRLELLSFAAEIFAAGRYSKEKTH